ncbi:MAG: LemA family protein [Oscillospiraceae bacterium]|nr:LemA family protein [Oscillospiraceae bacterium]
MEILITPLIIIIVAAVWWIIKSNDFNRKAVKVDEGLSGVEVALTKRYDMLTKLLDVVKGYAEHEKTLFSQVTEMRSGMSFKELNKAIGETDAMAGRLFAVAEGYPELRAADVFRELQSGIRDAEEHLQASRRLYNTNVTAFNSAIVVFPASIVAKSKRLEKREFFVAEENKREDVAMKF